MYDGYEIEELIDDYDGLMGEQKESDVIKFISYDGAWPNLCSGILTIEVEGKKYLFGPDYKKPADATEFYESFWYSGGTCGFMGGDYNKPNITKGPWHIETRYLPKELLKYAIEIARLVNKNIPWGCCGGCL